MSARTIHNRQTLTRMAACAAVGLSYWSGHPLAGHVWAVDDYRNAYVVRIYARDGMARITGRWSRGYQWSVVDGAAMPFVVSDETASLFRVAA